MQKLRKQIAMILLVCLGLTSVGQVVAVEASQLFQAGNPPECKVYPGGNPKGPILIMIAGWNTSATVDSTGTTSLISYWGDLYKNITDLYNGIVFYSYNRNGQTYTPEDTYLDVFNHHTPLLDDLIQSCVAKGYNSFDLIGHSLGGVVAMDYITIGGIRHPGLVGHVVTLDSPVNGGERIYRAAFLPTSIGDILENQIGLWVGQRIGRVKPGDQTSLAEVAAWYVSRANQLLINKNAVRMLLTRGTRIATFTNSDDQLILPTDALIPDAFGQEFHLGNDIASCNLSRCDIGHERIFQTGKYAEVRNAIRAELQTAPPATPTPPVPIVGQSATFTVLIFDTSGSMSELDTSGKTKLQAAQGAGASILSIITAEDQALGTAANQVGVVDFNNSARVDAPLATDVAAAQAALQGFNPNGGTGMPDGLQTAIGLFGNIPSGVKPIVILLTDGMPNVGHGGDQSLSVGLVQQQVLDLATQAGQQGECIYTVGFGVPQTVGTLSGQASIDEDFLKRVSVASGCGTYFNAQNAAQLANIYVSLRHTSTGNVLLDQTGQISQGQQVNAGTASVPANQSLMLFTLNWPGSRLDPLLTDPSGTAVDARYPGATISSAPTIVSIVVSNPKPGQWRVGAMGADVPEGTTAYHVVISTRAGTVTTTSTPIGSFPLVILTIVGSGSAVGVYVLMRSTQRRRASQQASLGGARNKAHLIGTTGIFAGQTVALGEAPFSVGRSVGNSLRLAEAQVSRQHAVIQYAQGRWFIQDQNSAGGTYVNGQRVTATSLSNGDRIRIGNTEFEFRSR